VSAPERIYLQWVEDEADKYMPEGVTWCQDQIEDGDVEYVRADKAAAELQELRTVAQNTMALGLITEDQPLLLARARAALEGTKGGGA
jgi:hypothetical protein